LGVKARARVAQLFSFERRKRELSTVIQEVTKSLNPQRSDRKK
jgi:hypothetical protein